MAKLILDGYMGINTEIASLLVENHKYVTDDTENEELWEILENTATKVDISIGEEYEDAAWFDFTFHTDTDDSHIVYEGVTRPTIRRAIKTGNELLETITKRDAVA